MANRHLKQAHPVTIQIALNYSAFHLELTDSADKAMKIAIKAYTKTLGHGIAEISEELWYCAAEQLNDFEEYIDENTIFYL